MKIINQQLASVRRPLTLDTGPATPRVAHCRLVTACPNNVALGPVCVWRFGGYYAASRGVLWHVMIIWDVCHICYVANIFGTLPCQLGSDKSH